MGSGSVTTLACGTTGVGASTVGGSFLDLFLLGRVAHRVRFSPALGLVCLFGLDESVVGVAGGLKEVALSMLKIGSPSSSKSCVVLMSQGGYRREGLTFVAKLASERRRALSGVDNRF